MEPTNGLLFFIVSGSLLFLTEVHDEFSNSELHAYYCPHETAISQLLESTVYQKE